MIYARNKETGEHRVAVIPGCYAFDEKWELIQADADGWIEWHGGKCPLPEEIVAEFTRRGRAGFSYVVKAVAGAQRWSHRGFYSDVIAYRPILSDQEQGMTLAAHENKFGPEPESGANTREPARPFMTGSMKASFGQPKQWRGPEDGLPPVGTVCEMDVGDGDTISVEVVAHYKGSAVVCSANDAPSYNGYGERIFTTMESVGPRCLRPIRTDRERWIEAANKACGDGEERFTPEFTEDVFGKLYDAGLARLPEE